MDHKVVTQEEWTIARKALLIREKELTKLKDEESRARRELPWVKVDKNYTFQTSEGKRTLSELFGKNSQLVVYHFMFAPGWKEGCPGCSFISDHIDGCNLHLAHHDVSLVVVSRAPLEEFEPFKQRMGWKFRWVSSAGTDFNYDFGVSFTPDQRKTGAVYNYERQPDLSEELHGLSVFYRDTEGEVFHTYSTYGRGCDILLGTHNYLDLTPKGRNERTTMDWMRHHDRYEDAPLAADCCAASPTECGCSSPAA